MKIHIKKQYYRHSKVGRSPASYKARQPEGKGTDVFMDMKVDPILRKKKARDLKKGIMRHEIEEVRAWGKGSTSPHRDASAKEPKVTRKLGGTSGFWKEAHKRGLI